MHLIITLRKEVPDEATAQVLFETVVTFLEDKPDVTVTGSVNTVLLKPEPPE